MCAASLTAAAPLIPLHHGHTLLQRCCHCLPLGGLVELRAVQPPVLLLKRLLLRQLLLL